MSLKNEEESHKILPPGQKAIKKILRWYIDHPGITNTIPKIDLEKWTLTIEGEVEKPLKLCWNDFLKFPKVKSVSNFHCVEGWSVLAREWEGSVFKYIVDLVKPKETARFVIFKCLDGYTTSFSLTDLLDEDVLLAHRLDGKDLEENLGGPLRLVVPRKYAYKSAMWITKIRFQSKNELGYWEIRGYSDTADVWKNDRYSK